MKREEILKLRLKSMTSIEKELWSLGSMVAGIDEVGRGPLAGPVVAACVVMPASSLILGVNDSKKLSEKRRNELYKEIKEKAVRIGIGIVDNHVIDEINILNATKMAMRLAYEDMRLTPNVVLIDALNIALPCDVIPIVKGDELSYSIAAASIVAKVTRDNMMAKYGEQFPYYGFDKNKGYGTKQHILSILEHGACFLHRASFLRGILKNA